ncbi:type II secretion system minor pseudopilin GspJ [Psychrobacter glacincola]|uniref:Type II secretion system protein J n=1 Tax=Psychrobacter glacincola TaxID=56810 RepID=A0ABW1W7S1_9GAMM|nr:type II secretion system minor pseudopilin GspJ [Psychrobacter glacincola]
MREQRGFTLLELMVAMAIFAMLAVAGWQVFDSVNRARERAQFHADNLAVLQYAYLQLQQDMGQIVPYQAVSTQNANALTNASNIDNANNSNQENTPQPVPEPFMSLDGEHVSFVRFADPDPRYQSSPSMQRVEYIFVDERLIRRQYTSVGGSDSISLDSVLLEGVTAGRWQAYLPEMSTKFPSEDSNSNNASLNSQSGQGTVSANAQPEIVLLPKGVAVTFTYQDMPITWQWALTPQPIPNNSANKNNTPDNSNGNGNGNGNGNSDTNNDNSNGTSNNDAANGNVDNDTLGNGI